MARNASPIVKGSIVPALALALAVAFSSAPSLADSPASSDANSSTQASAPQAMGPAAPTATAPQAATTVPVLETAKPTPAERGDAQSFLDARDGYSEAQDLFKSQEYAHALSVLDENIATLNWVITHAEDRRLRISAGELLRRSASLRLACSRAVDKERTQIDLTGPPSPVPHVVETPADSTATVTDTTEAPAIATEDNPRVQKWIDYYTGRGRGLFETWLSRSGLYMEWMKTILRGEGLPTDLVHLVFVESGFNPQALSRSHAVGPWQFIRGTAKIFGLQVNSWIDERRDPERATQAAAHYLKHLYSVFDSWPLALASYNAGEGTVVRAIARQGTNDFWQLSLPRETRDYVPKFLACLSIARNPQQYGFDDVPRQDPLAFETVRIPGPVDLNAVAAACNASQEDLRKLNPAFLRYAAPSDPSGMVTIRVPQGTADSLVTKLGDGTINLPAVSTPADPAFVRYRVKRGETLAQIAFKNGITVGELARANHLSTKSHVHKGQMLRVPGGDVAYASTASTHVSSGKHHASHDADGEVYAGTRTVKIHRGDTLQTIADRHNTDVRTLRALNNLRPHEQIRAGGTLKVPVQGQEG
jgi:membrane-bound lytic murein transglycosylase D